MKKSEITIISLEKIRNNYNFTWKNQLSFDKIVSSRNCLLMSPHMGSSPMSHVSPDFRIWSSDHNKFSLKKTVNCFSLLKICWKAFLFWKSVEKRFSWKFFAKKFSKNNNLSIDQSNLVLVHWFSESNLFYEFFFTDFKIISRCLYCFEIFFPFEK